MLVHRAIEQATLARSLITIIDPAIRRFRERLDETQLSVFYR
jgi:hypothetical protein